MLWQNVVFFSFSHCSSCCPLCGPRNNLDPINMFFLGCIKGWSGFFWCIWSLHYKAQFLPPTRGRRIKKAKSLFWNAHLSIFKTDLPWYPPAITRKQLKKSKPDQVFTLSERPLPLGFTLHVNHYAFGCRKLLKECHFCLTISCIKKLCRHHLRLCFYILAIACKQEQSVGKWAAFNTNDHCSQFFLL